MVPSPALYAEQISTASPIFAQSAMQTAAFLAARDENRGNGVSAASWRRGTAVSAVVFTARNGVSEPLFSPCHGLLNPLLEYDRHIRAEAEPVAERGVKQELRRGQRLAESDRLEDSVHRTVDEMLVLP